MNGCGMRFAAWKYEAPPHPISRTDPMITSAIAKCDHFSCPIRNCSPISNPAPSTINATMYRSIPSGIATYLNRANTVSEIAMTWYSRKIQRSGPTVFRKCFSNSRLVS